MQRNLTIDIAKGVGIILVVIGHLPTTLGGVIYTFHMAFFFMLSGWCFSDRHLGAKCTFLKKRTISLLLPWFLCKFPFWSIKHLGIFPEILKTSIEYHWLGTMWFLPALFMAEVILLVVLQVFLKFRYSEWLSVMSILALVYVISFFSLSISAYFYYALFYAIGYALKVSSNGVLKALPKKLWSIGILGLSYLSMIYLKSFVPATISLCDHSTYLLYLITSLSGSFLVIQFCIWTSKHTETLRDIFVLIGQKTMSIVLFQWFAFWLLQGAVDNEIIIVNNENLLVFSKFIIGLTVPILLNEFYQNIKHKKWIQKL